jgi:hypothetical protein
MIKWGSALRHNPITPLITLLQHSGKYGRNFRRPIASQPRADLPIFIGVMVIMVPFDIWLHIVPDGTLK